MHRLDSFVANKMRAVASPEQACLRGKFQELDVFPGFPPIYCLGAFAGPPNAQPTEPANRRMARGRRTRAASRAAVVMAVKSVKIHYLPLSLPYARAALQRDLRG